MKLDWLQIFDEVYKENGVSEKDITTLVEQIGLPLSEDEIHHINVTQRNPYPINNPLYNYYKPLDPTKWVIPDKPLPSSYLDFLRWSNGGWFRTEEREFDFFSTLDLRSIQLGAAFPQYMPNVIPFASDGGGNYYVFDMREKAIDEEYPIFIVDTSNLGFEDAKFLAPAFVEACKGLTKTSDVLYN